MTPRTRAECPTERPCPHVERCRYGLPRGACALDVADDGEHSPELVGAALGVTRQRVDQIERRALRTVAERLRVLGVDLPDASPSTARADRIRALLGSS